MKQLNNGLGCLVPIPIHLVGDISVKISGANLLFELRDGSRFIGSIGWLGLSPTLLKGRQRGKPVGMLNAYPSSRPPKFQQTQTHFSNRRPPKIILARIKPTVAGRTVKQTSSSSPSMESTTPMGSTTPWRQ